MGWNTCWSSPQVVLVAAGARERFLAFRGNTLPGVYGAGAFQTLVNRDLIRPAEKLFIVGGGNVGLIAGYHALQAGIEVVGLVEALPECGGYKVHKDKLVRMGVPIYTSHTILSASANGEDKVESVTIAQVDSNFQPDPRHRKILRLRQRADRGRPGAGR
jgi:sarcosine oxidase, subunit alpha